MSRVTIVTGAARGIGRAVVDLLISLGENVVAEDIDDSVRALESDSCATVVGDVADLSTARLAADSALRRFGRIDGLVNNAGRYLSKPISDISVDEWDGLFRTNVRGMFVHLQAALSELRRSHGAVVNLASISGLIGKANQHAYAGTKGAIVQMTRSAAIELAPDRVRVNAVAPGTVDTHFMDEALSTVADVDAYRARLAAGHPLGRLSTPAEVATAICFLLSADAGNITGTVLPVDGGFTAE